MAGPALDERVLGAVVGEAAGGEARPRRGAGHRRWIEVVGVRRAGVGWSVQALPSHRSATVCGKPGNVSPVAVAPRGGGTGDASARSCARSASAGPRQSFSASRRPVAAALGSPAARARPSHASKREASSSSSPTTSMYPRPRVTSRPPPRALRRPEIALCRLPDAEGGARSPHSASISSSLETGWFARRSRTASTTCCRPAAPRRPAHRRGPQGGRGRGSASLVCGDRTTGRLVRARALSARCRGPRRCRASAAARARPARS
jgi:hypothetical protein